MRALRIQDGKAADDRLYDHVAIVTGAGRGLGRLARMLSVHLDVGFPVSQPTYRVMKTRGYGRFGSVCFRKVISPELVVPIMVFLASRACEVTHHNYSACAGRFARAFVGRGPGWSAGPGRRTHRRGHRDSLVRGICDRTGHRAGVGVFSVCARLGVT
ncbi:hypothetical protein B1987_07375 [Mycobacterium kansasii]|uniref:Uncharacterized protein n=1 Tax=Mycobacterium attenuatum TaxID=2341086 RepID=A0A498Q9W3_9MYCO|nr:hypothetical protein B1987_07375 [Mycobacterium kansasii]VBA41624.1 hypothetical protein LAUMK136_04155 [Mycobacterium attenuatum]VBA57728.1 hypothetical protein LAUMK191_04152 [Mycobacterium attenuatum]